jgi:hypothetical protein
LETHPHFAEMQNRAQKRRAAARRKEKALVTREGSNG